MKSKFCSHNDIRTFGVTDILINMTVAPPISWKGGGACWKHYRSKEFI